jgi:hypothetical protein
MSEWKVAGGRIVLFPAAPSSRPLSALELFRQVWGGDPENFQKPPNPLVPALAQGKRKGMMVACSLHPSRIDFAFSSFSNSTVPVASPDLIQDARLFCAELKKLIGIIGTDTGWGPMIRVALNVQFQVQRQNFVEANNTLVAILPDKYKVGISDEEDFVLQVNDVYASRAVERIKMNCIKKWSVDRFQVVAFGLQSTGGIIRPQVNTVPNSPDIPQFITSSVMLDINSIPTSEPISSKNQAALIDEAFTRTAQELRNTALEVRGFQND